MSKISIRFCNDREVRDVWDEEKSKWWFSAVDIVAAITDSPNPSKLGFPSHCSISSQLCRHFHASRT